MALGQQLTLLNPWWHGETGWNVIPSSFRRDCHPQLVQAVENSQSEPGVLVVGFRRVGKTVLAKQILRHLHVERSVPVENIVYVDFQEGILADTEPADIVAWGMQRRLPRAPLCVVLDEIQFLHDWDRKLRGVLQSPVKDDLVLLATGSGASEIRRASGDVLLDRVRLFPLGPMTFAEWRRMAGRDSSSPAGLYEDLVRFGARGGFPGLVDEPSDHQARHRLRRLCEGRVIDGDLAPRLGIRERVTFGKLWRHFAHNPGVILDWSKLPGEFGVARVTFEGWVHALMSAEMIVELSPSKLSGSPLHGRKRYSRVYPVDHSLCHAYGVPVDEGGGLETAVFRHLRDLEQRRVDAGLTTFLTYWRDDRVSGSNEIDFRMEGDDISLLLEVRGTRRPALQDMLRLARITRRLKRNRAILVYGGIERSVQPTTIDDVDIGIHLWPVHLFLNALDGCSVSAEELWSVD